MTVIDGAWGRTAQLNPAAPADAAALSRIISESGRRAGARHDPAHLARVAEAAEFLADVLDGRRSPFWLQEALSTSDFPLLMGDILDRQLLGRYAEVTPTWSNYAKRGTVRDFRTVRRLQQDGLEGRLYPNYPRPEMAAPIADENLTETGYTYAVSVYEKTAALNWRMLINDDLDAFRTIPDRLARGARRTEEYFATTLFVDASGPHASLYTSGNHNIVNTTNGASATNPALSISALQDGMTVLMRQTDANGEPIALEAVELVVPPTLAITAQNILNAIQLELTIAGGTVDNPASGTTGGQRLIAQNWMKGRVRLSVNYYIPTVASSAHGSTSWFLFANPDASRPALEMGFLRGYEQPGLFQKAPNMQRIGGAVDPVMGDFDTGELTYKVMHILGGTRLDGRATVASNGSGS